MGLCGASGGGQRPDLSVIIPSDHMPGPGVHGSVPKPSAKAIQRASVNRKQIEVPYCIQSIDKTSLSRRSWICDLEARSQLWACEEPVAVVGALICPS